MLRIRSHIGKLLYGKIIVRHTADSRYRKLRIRIYDFIRNMNVISLGKQVHHYDIGIVHRFCSFIQFQKIHFFSQAEDPKCRIPFYQIHAI